jgi:hypothetical protein
VPVEAPSSRRTSFVQGGLMLAFAGWLGYYVISEPPYLSLRVFGPTAAFHAVTAAAGIAYLLYLSFRRRLPQQTFLDWAVFALLLAYGAATAASINWRVSLETTLLVVTVVLVFYVAVDGDLLGVHDVRRAFLLVAAAAAAFALFKVGRDYWDWLRLARAVDPSWGPRDLLPPTVPRVHGVGDHENLLAMALALAVPFYVVGLLSGQGRLARLTAAGALVLTGAALFFTLSRAGWVAAATAAALAVVGWGQDAPCALRNGDCGACRCPRAGVAAGLPLGVPSGVAVPRLALTPAGRDGCRWRDVPRPAFAGCWPGDLWPPLRAVQRDLPR